MISAAGSARIAADADIARTARVEPVTVGDHQRIEPSMGIDIRPGKPHAIRVGRKFLANLSAVADALQF